MKRMRVRLITQSDVITFCNIASTIEEEVNLTDNSGHCVNAKSLLGCLYSVEFEETYVECENEVSLHRFNAFMI